MRMLVALIAVALLFVGLPAASVAAPIAQTDGVAQPSNRLYIQGDMVDGTCVMRSRYAPGERVVFRVRVLDSQTGEMARDAVVTVTLDNGTVLPLRFSAHPARPPQTDEFWATSWTVPDDTPEGVVRFSVEAVDGARTGRYEPFNVESSLLTIVSQP